MKIKGLILAGLTLLFASTSAQAIVFDINTCWSSCDNTGNLDVTVATVEAVQNGDAVDFTVTSSTDNLLTYANAGTFISQVLFNYTGDLTTLSFSAVTGDANGSIVLGDRTNAGLNFNLELDLETSNCPTCNRLLTGESVMFTALAVTNVDDFVSPVMAHIQGLANGGSVKYVDGNGNGVPEPGVLGLLGIGLLGIVLGRRRMAV